MTYDVFNLKLPHDTNVLFNPFRPRSYKPEIVLRGYHFTSLPIEELIINIHDNGSVVSY